MHVRESKPQNRVGLPRGLFLRGKGYALRVAIPTNYRDVIGKREIVRGLGTQDLAEALKRRPKVLEEILAVITEGKTPFQTLRTNIPKRENTVRDTADRWLAESDGINSSTKVRYRQHLRTFEAYSENIQVTDINRSLVLGFIEHFKATPSKRTGQALSGRSLQSCQSCLASYWRVLDHWGLVDPDMRNPFGSLLR